MLGLQGSYKGLLKLGNIAINFVELWLLPVGLCTAYFRYLSNPEAA